MNFKYEAVAQLSDAQRKGEVKNYGLKTIKAIHAIKGIEAI